MIMDQGSIGMLAIAATMLVGLVGVMVSIFVTSSATHRRIDDFRADIKADMDHRFNEVDRRFGEINHRFDEVDRRLGDVDQKFAAADQRFAGINGQLADLRIDFRDMRGRLDHIADSLSLGRSRIKKRA